jgi:hypothetical protein
MVSESLGWCDSAFLEPTGETARYCVSSGGVKQLPRFLHELLMGVLLAQAIPLCSQPLLPLQSPPNLSLANPSHA